MFLQKREDNLTQNSQNSLGKISSAESYTAMRDENEKLFSRIRNEGFEEVVTKPKVVQHRNCVGSHYTRKCKPQRAENLTVRVSRRNGDSAGKIPKGELRTKMRPNSTVLNRRAIRRAAGCSSSLVRAVSPKWSATARKWSKIDAQTTKMKYRI